jgi:Sec-independent protein translocase protein TatA
MTLLGPAEIALIIVVAAVFFFGKDKVLDWVRSMGLLKKEFKDATKGEEKSKTKKKKK